MKSLVRDIAEQITVAADSIEAIALRLGVRRVYLALLVRLSYWTGYMSPLWTRKPPSLTADAISEKRHQIEIVFANFPLTAVPPAGE
jgi:hypothetical protein